MSRLRSADPDDESKDGSLVNTSQDPNIPKNKKTTAKFLYDFIRRESTMVNSVLEGKKLEKYLLNEVIQTPDYEFKVLIHHKESLQEFLRDRTKVVFR